MGIGHLCCPICLPFGYAQGGTGTSLRLKCSEGRFLIILFGRTHRIMFIRTLFWDSVLKDTLCLEGQFSEYDEQKCAIGDRKIPTFCPKCPFIWSQLIWLKPSMQENIFSLFLFSCIFFMLSRYQVVIQSLAAVTSTGVSRDIVRGGAELRGKSRDSDRKRNRQPISQVQSH